MTTAKELLAMIEAVKPDDAGALEVLEQKVHIYRGYFWDSDGEEWDHENRDHEEADAVEKYTGDYLIPEYCSDRNVLKAIRPEDWYWEIRVYGDSNYAQATRKSLAGTRKTPNLPTETLAELHAIIQAIEWERQNGK